VLFVIATVAPLKLIPAATGVHTVTSPPEIVPASGAVLTVIFTDAETTELQTPLDAINLNHVVCVKAPVLKVINGLAALTALCATTLPELLHEIPSADDCNWISPILPAAKDKTTLDPSQAVKAGVNLVTTVGVATFDNK